MPASHRPSVSPFVAAVIATLAASGLRWYLQPVMGNHMPYITYSLAVAAGGYAGGLVPGLTATVLGAACGWTYFMEVAPVEAATPTHVTGLTMFLIVGTVISLLAEGLHSARRRADQATAIAVARQREFIALVDNSPDMVARLDRSLRYTYVNATVRTGVGLSPADFLGKTFHEVGLSAELVPAWEAASRKAFDEARETRHEFTLNGPNGPRHYLRRVVPEFGADGTVASLLSVTSDLTELKAAERELRESEARFRLLAENGRDIITRSTPDSRVIYVSPACKALLGWSPEELVGRCAFDLFHPDDLARLSTVQRAKPGDRDACLIHRFRHRDGGYLWFESLSHKLTDPTTGETLEYQASSRDVTARVAAEEALRRSEERFRLAARACSDGIWDLDLLTRRLLLTKPFTTLFGHTSDQVIEDGFNWWGTLVHPDDHKKAVGDLELVLQGRSEYWSAAYRLRRADGTYADVLDHAFLVRDEAGAAVRVIGAIRDVTERKRLEEQLRQAQKLEAFGQLAGGIAHDFNNLLTAIIGNLELIDLDDSDPAAPLLDSAALAASRAAELTKQLLSFARRGPLEARPVHVDNLISEVVTLLRRTIDPRIVLEIPTAPPPPPVWADPGQIGQVLLNLCLNARDAMPDGGTLRLSAAQASSKKSEEPHGHVRLRVEDTGCGMDAATQARLFEPFFTTKLRGKGTGLGLAMAYGIARQHNGWIECHSAPGRGSCFDLYLPCAHHQAVPAPTNDTPMSEHPTTGGATVLLVDDEEPVRTLAATVLTRNGYDVLHAVDGVEGLDIYRRERDRIDLILLDLTMPRLSGLDTLKRLQELNPDVRVLLTSGYNNQSAVDPKKARFHGFVPKPYKAAELLRAIVAALAVRPSQLVQSEMSSTLTASQPSPAVTQTF